MGCSMLNKEKIALYLKKIPQLALQALLYEVAVTPKPGLVDKNNSGSHRNMDFLTFMRSAAALSPYWGEFTTLGYEFGEKGKSLEELFLQSRVIGSQAEDDMFAATGNVNTHKGLIFSLGLVCCACGYIIAAGQVPSTEDICHKVEIMTKGIIASDLDSLRRDRKLTSGERLYFQYGLTGIRGEAQSGFKTVRTVSLPALKEMTGAGFDINKAALQALISLMVNTTDTNVVARHGLEALEYVQKTAAAYLAKGGVPADVKLEGIKQMDEDFISRNISPGGCADLLCLTLMFYKISRENLKG